MGRRNRQKGTLSATWGCMVWLLMLGALTVLGACTFYFREPLVDKFGNAFATPSPTPAPDYKAIVDQFRRAESAAVASALEEGNADVMAALAVFASGDALASVQKEVAGLQRNNRFEKFTLENLAVQQVIPNSSTAVQLLVDETHLRQTYARAATGDTLLGTDHYTASVAYQLGYDGQRWRVDDIGVASTTPIHP
jgi:hypothetical protein